MAMRLKKSESCDDFGNNGVLHPQIFRNNNNSKLIKFGEVMKTNAECHSTHTQPVDDITDNDADDDNDSGVHRGGKFQSFSLFVNAISKISVCLFYRVNNHQ
ncbi:unnamed protein product [Onchocerca flexuosa]|uniref:Ovule protein n=1 Tax=Onchocerca flexuosa TaxID=387005 RepID=A0A183HFA8_9BILA|nr:unnamed protein product [Onchocerca flexuosa]